MPIRSKLVLYVVAPLLVGMLGLCALLLYELREAALAEAERETAALVEGQATAIAERLDSVERLARALGATLSQPAPHGFAGHTEASLNELLAEWLTLDPLTFGLTAAFEPGAFQGRERFAPYWMLRDDAPTLVNIHEQYDYTDPQYKWYTASMAADEIYWLDPYYGPASKALMTAVSAPVLNDGARVGFVGFGVPLERLAETTWIDRLGGRDYALISGSGKIVYHADNALHTRPATDYVATSSLFAHLGQLQQDGEPGSIRVPSIATPGDTAWLHTARVGDSGWQLVVRDLQSEMLGPHKERIFGIGAGMVLLVLLGTLAAAHVAGRLTRPLRHLKRNVEQVTSGDLDVKIEVDSHDEIGELSDAFALMTRHLASRNATLLSRTCELENAQGELQKLAWHDPLTGLPNRTHFKQQVDIATRLAKRSNVYCAILFIDLDNFKRINDTLGHNAGDDLLVGVSQRLEECLRGSDTMTRNAVDISSLLEHSPDDVDDAVARLGGDEFTILLSSIQEEQDASCVAARIVDALAEPFDLDGKSMVISPSCGIALYPRDGTTVDELLKHADTAMYEAKKAGKNRFEFFDRQMSEKVHAQMDMERRIREGLEGSEFALHFQPKVQPDNRQCRGSEALLRWTPRNGPPVSPAQFIPVAESTGLLLPLGEWAFTVACQQAADWARDSSAAALLPVSVNVSSSQFAQDGFVAVLANIIDETGASPHNIEVELTESVLMNDAEAQADTLRAIKALGVEIAVDDFGTGYSSLAYLQRFPLDTLKIDQAFVAKVPDDEESSAIALAIITMAHSLHLKVVAEGVETEAQAAFLQEHGCDMLQGWLLAPALPHDEARAWAQAQTTGRARVRAAR